MNKTQATNIPIKNLDVALNRDVFSRSLVGELSGLLEEMIGLEEASGFISVVGQRIGSEIGEAYKNALQVDKLSKQQISEVLVDLKHRIQGGFYIIELTDEKVVLGNTACPFEDKVLNKPSLCMMTSNVFGSIAAENNGYAKVTLNETIARGNASCLVTVYFKPTDEANRAEGRVYYDAN